MRIGYIASIENALPHGVELGLVELWGQQYHGVADSSLRQGQVGPMQNGLRDKQVLGSP